MAGRLAFGWDSPTWDGGIAFHEPEGQGTVLARVYLVTSRQFADVLEQEMRREPGADHDLTEVLARRRHAVGPGRYETQHLVGELEGRPVVTFSAPDVDALGLRAPAPAYLATMARGLRATHDLTDAEVADYLLGCRGIELGWDREALLRTLA